MNPKVSFLILLGLVAAGYYAYDPELNTLHKLSGGRIGKPAAAKVSAAKPKAKKKEARPASVPAAVVKKATPAPAAEPAPEPAADATPAPAAEPQAAPAAEPEATPAADSGKPKMAPAGSARVADVLATLPLVKEGVKPNKNARYYIYLMSAGWCGPCNQEMPHIVKTYEEIRSMGVAELILIDFDGKPEEALAYMDKYGATFPAIMQDKAPVLPGIQPPGGIPSAIIVDETGNMVKSGHGSIIQQWKQHITDYEAANGIPSSLDSLADAPEDDADDDKASGKKKTAKNSKAVARALTKVKWASGRPSRKAKYYIYLQSASWCGPCRQEMPVIAEEYKAMKKDGRVELLLIGFDQTEDAAKNFLKSNGATFPMVLKGAKGVNNLPGYTEAQGIPTAIFVNAAGEVIAQGHGAMVKNWRQHTIDKEDAQ